MFRRCGLAGDWETTMTATMTTTKTYDDHDDDDDAEETNKKAVQTLPNVLKTIRFFPKTAQTNFKSDPNMFQNQCEMVRMAET